MATALYNMTEAPAAAPLPPLVQDMSADINSLTGVVHQIPIREPAPGDELPIPEKILVRQIGLIEGPNGPFGYINPDKPRPYSEAALARILDDLREGHYEPTTRDEPFNRPLDVSLTANTVFVFFLSDQRRWRFTRGTRAITLGNVAEEDQNNYYSLRHIIADGEEVAGPYSQGECKIVTFMGRRMSDKFVHPFNFNIELVYDNDIEGQNTLPLVIDPDVRYPGGSGS